MYLDGVVSGVSKGMACRERFLENEGRVYFGRGEGKERIDVAEVEGCANMALLNRV